MSARRAASPFDESCDVFIGAVRSEVFDSRVKTSVSLRRGGLRVAGSERRRDHGEGFEKFFSSLAAHVDG